MTRPEVFAERSALINRKFDGGLSPDEQERLDVLNAECDRIQSAEMAPALERLERIVEKQERLAEEVSAFVAALPMPPDDGSPLDRLCEERFAQLHTRRLVRS